jgi:hypothetical protein
LLKIFVPYITITTDNKSQREVTMDDITVETLEDIAPHVVEHLLPAIQDAVEVAVAAYKADHFNDSWTFGTHLWKNTWNRFKSAARFEDCPFTLCGKGNEYKLKIGRYIIRHHKIDDESSIPTGAKAVKESAGFQLSLLTYCGLAPVERRSIDNIVIAIVANMERVLGKCLWANYCNALRTRQNIDGKKRCLFI